MGVALRWWSSKMNIKTRVPQRGRIKLPCIIACRDIVLGSPCTVIDTSRISRYWPWTLVSDGWDIASPNPSPLPRSPVTVRPFVRLLSVHISRPDLQPAITHNNLHVRIKQVQIRLIQPRIHKLMHRFKTSHINGRSG